LGADKATEKTTALHTDYFQPGQAALTSAFSSAAEDGSMIF
jgi:hypothetical protein